VDAIDVIGHKVLCGKQGARLFCENFLDALPSVHGSLRKGCFELPIVGEATCNLCKVSRIHGERVPAAQLDYLLVVESDIVDSGHVRLLS
jgi:hypothetical protein